LECVAVYWSVLQCIGVCCSVLECVAVYWSVLQETSVACYGVATASRIDKIIGLFCRM